MFFRQRLSWAALRSVEYRFVKILIMYAYKYVSIGNERRFKDMIKEFVLRTKEFEGET